MSDEPIPNVIDELDTPGPLRVLSPRRYTRKVLPPVLGLDDDPFATIPTRGQRSMLAAPAQSTEVAVGGPTLARANVSKTGPTKLEQDPIRSPRVTEGATNGRPIDQLFRKCTDAAQQFKNSKKREEHLLMQCLQKAALLYEYGESQDPEGYALLLSHHKIRVTARTHNPFLPIVKLVFGAVEKGQRTNLSRYAGVLRFAHEKGVEPHAFPHLFKEEGGLDGCAEKDREAHPSPERQAASTKHAAHLQALKAQAHGADLSEVADELQSGLTAVLIEKDQHGNLQVLGLRTETFEHVRRYRPLIAVGAQEQ
ncbi:hypothetical protein [Methylobacterium sp. Leaf85]|uniref:hypothetical protein n=1 Tax=Methylobacterium sp. Leaf85 TaxID=1736241 RepID=UPI000ADC510D|nr:hypothetical protein [Methylobacterium sp. Leaf85]